MRKLFFGLLCFSGLGCIAAEHFDLVIVGGNPGGIMAAVEAARMGKKSIILERNAHIGGLPANGLGATDIATRGATTGLFSEFTKAVRKYYADTYGEDSKQVRDCSDGFHFEPSVAERIFHNLIDAEGDMIDVRTMRQFNFSTGDISMSADGSYIDSIRVVNRNTGDEEFYAGSVFIDATYEGDLGAAAGVPFRIGREDVREFSEPGAGVTYEYWKSLPADGSTGAADNAVQAYNYRLCLTRDTAQLVPFSRPENYDRSEYSELAEDVWTGRNTWRMMRDVTPEMLERNRERLLAGGSGTTIPGDSWGIEKLVTINTEPNGKTDANNQHGAFISTDLPEENWPWPTSSWEWRDRFARRLRDYTMGLFYFAATDSTLPEQFRREIQRWGLSAQEYQDNGNFPRQVYVREGRRFEGVYFFTAKDALPVEKGGRPPLHSSSITASHYALDSHAARKRETGRVHLDGFISYPTAVYTVPYGVIVPRTVTNLLLPVPVSGSHIGFSTLRMEPCWMALGQAAGAAASLAIDLGTSVQDVPIDRLQSRLIDEKVTLIYFEDVTPDDPDFARVQRQGLSGELTGWKARDSRKK